MTFAVPARIKEAFSAFHEKWELSERHSIEDRAITKLLEFYGQEEQLEDEFFRLKEWHSLLNGRYTGELKKLWDNYIEHTAMHRMKLMKGRLVVSKSWSANCDVHGYTARDDDPSRGGATHLWPAAAFSGGHT